MARGRIINNRITTDIRVHNLSDDLSRLAFTWLITFADREGRAPGDPVLLRSLLFPRRTDISPDDLERYLTEWDAAGLVHWYRAGGDLYVHFPGFDGNQTGLRKDREAPSYIPPPEDGEPVRSKSGVNPEQLQVKLKEKKRKEDNGSAAVPHPIFSEYERAIGPLTPMVADQLKLLEEEYPQEWVTLAFQEAARQNARSLAYVQGVLKNRAANKPKPKSKNEPITIQDIEGIYK